MVREIRYIKNAQIDKKQWDKCIENAFNSLIYAQSWYLDITAGTWDALILGDYEVVMPLPWRKKFGIKYIFQPYFTQQLGVFGKTESIDISEFIQLIPKDFKHISLNLNEYNKLFSNILRENVNFKLDISEDYSRVSSYFNRNCKRNLKKAESAGFKLTTDVSPEEFVSFIRHHLGGRMEKVRNHEYEILTRLVQTTMDNKSGELIALTDEKNILHAAGFYLFSKDSLIFSVCASTPYGIENQAMYKLVDSQIRKYCTQYKWYDFSGSNMDGIAYFNSTFGAVKTTYKTISINRLPPGIRRLKK